MAINTTTLEANLTTKINATSGTTDGKEFLLLGKAVEALTIPSSVSEMTAAGATQVAAVNAAGSSFAPKADPTFTGTVNAAALTLSGNLTVNGTTTTVNSATLDVADKNITVAKGAANSAAADGSGLTIEGAGVTFNYVDANKHMALNTGLDVGGTLKVDEILEKATIDTSTTGAFDVGVLDDGVVLFFTNNQTANRTINFRGSASTTLNSMMAVGESMSAAVLMTQGSSAYYINGYNVDASSVTPKWQGGTAPTAGNASGIDVYTFTLIKTAANTFTVLATLAAFA